MLPPLTYYIAGRDFNFYLLLLQIWKCAVIFLSVIYLFNTLFQVKQCTFRIYFFTMSIRVTSPQKVREFLTLYMVIDKIKVSQGYRKS